MRRKRRKKEEKEEILWINKVFLILKRRWRRKGGN